MDITAALNAYPEAYAPLRDAALRYVQYPSRIGDSGTLSIAHRPWVARSNYMFTLYPGLAATNLADYSSRFSLQIPDLYADFLRSINGAFCFGMSLCGVPPSMLGNPPLLDRKTLQCHDLATAATQWVNSYQVPKDFFHFGSRHFSAQENVGYFIDSAGRIVSIRAKTEIAGEWTNFTDFLKDELEASERLEGELHPAKWG